MHTEKYMGTLTHKPYTKQAHAHTHIQRMSTLGRWRSSTGDWCKLAGWRSVSLSDRDSALGPPSMSGDLWGKLLAFSALWHHSGTRNREREGKRELEALQNKTAEESPHLLCQLIYVALWLGVATEPDTCWSPHDWTHLWTNWTLQGAFGHRWHTAHTEA